MEVKVGKRKVGRKKGSYKYEQPKGRTIGICLTPVALKWVSDHLEEGENIADLLERWAREGRS